MEDIKIFCSNIQIFKGVFSITKPTLTFGGAVPLNVVATKYDRFSTLPYLQLSGWTAADAFLLGLFMIAGYFIYAYSTASLVDIEPLRRSKRCNFDKSLVLN